jgi:hypothetical protein
VNPARNSAYKTRIITMAIWNVRLRIRVRRKMKNRRPVKIYPGLKRLEKAKQILGKV